MFQFFNYYEQCVKKQIWGCDEMVVGLYYNEEIQST